jgi:hypothetical protein
MEIGRRDTDYGIIGSSDEDGSANNVLIFAELRFPKSSA